MSDTQAAMREFRFLDETRKTNGLTPVEEQRWYELAQGLGVDVGQAQPQAQGYYADDGNWYPYPEGYDPATGQYAAGYAPEYAQQPQAPNQGWYPPPQQQPQGYYGQDGNWYPYPPGYDPATGQYYQGYAPQPSYPQQWAQPQPQPQPAYDHTTGQWSYPQPSAPAVDYAQQAWQPPAPVVDDGPLEVSSDEVMEIGDDEVSPVASAPSSSPSRTGEEQLASLRSALSFEDELDVGKVAEQAAATVAAEPVVTAPKPSESRVPEVSLGDFGSLEDEAPLTQNTKAPAPNFASVLTDEVPTRVGPVPTANPAVVADAQEQTLPRGFEVSLLEEVPTRVYPANAQRETLKASSSVPRASPPVFAPISASFDVVAPEKTPAAAQLEPLEAPLSAPAPLPLEAETAPLSAPVSLEVAAPVPLESASEKTPQELNVPREVAPVAVPFETVSEKTPHELSVPREVPFEAVSEKTPHELAAPEELAAVPLDIDFTPTSENRVIEEVPKSSVLGAELGDGSESDSPPTTIEAMPAFGASLDEVPALVPEAPSAAPAPARTMSALDSLAIGPEVPLEAPLLEPELPLLDVVALAPSSPSGFADWSKVPIVESPQLQVLEPQLAALDDQPIPEEVPVDLSGSASDSIELASSAQFVSYSNQTEQLDVDLDDSGDFEVDSSSLAALATGINESKSGASSVPEEKLELVSASEFIDAPALTSTGERWVSTNDSLALEVERPIDIEDDGEIVQGIVLEDDAPVPVAPPSAPKHAELSWGGAMPTRPSPPPMPFPKVVTAPSAPIVVPAPAPVAMPVSAFVPPAPPPPKPVLNTRVATPIAPAPADPVPMPVPMPVSDPFDRSGVSFGAEPVQILVSGEHRVILHTVEGQVKRGSIREANLGAETVVLEGPSIENLPRARVKAIFFMLAPGARAPTADGEKVRVTFKDGRQVAGFSRDQKNAAIGFFVVPADNRTNTERIFIYRHAVQNVVVE